MFRLSFYTFGPQGPQWLEQIGAPRLPSMVADMWAARVSTAKTYAGRWASLAAMCCAAFGRRGADLTDRRRPRLGGGTGLEHVDHVACSVCSTTLRSRPVLDPMSGDRPQQLEDAARQSWLHCAFMSTYRGGPCSSPGGHIRVTRRHIGIERR